MIENPAWRSGWSRFRRADCRVKNKPECWRGGEFPVASRRQADVTASGRI